MSDHYSGYYWGTNPYSSSGLKDNITDVELRNKVIERISTLHKIRTNTMEISVKYATVTIKGNIKTFQEKKLWEKKYGE
ncbi:MAG: hypothetical protein ACRD8Z_20150 [Nitrososphaeraceae archaeon]